MQHNFSFYTHNFTFWLYKDQPRTNTGWLIKNLIVFSKLFNMSHLKTSKDLLKLYKISYFFKIIKIQGVSKKVLLRIFRKGWVILSESVFELKIKTYNNVISKEIFLWTLCIFLDTIINFPIHFWKIRTNVLFVFCINNKRSDNRYVEKISNFKFPLNNTANVWDY